MTGVTHGADAERLLEVVDGLRGQGERVREIGDALMPLAGVLQESWGGQDCEALVADVQELRPGVASIGATLLAWADVLRGQADQQLQASDGPGRAVGDGAGNRATPPEPLQRVRDFADFLGRGAAGQDRGGSNPLLAALDGGPRHSGPRGDNTPAGDPFDVLKSIVDDKAKNVDVPKGTYSESESRGKIVKLTLTGSATHDDAGINDEGKSLESTTVTGKAELSAEAKLRLGKVGLDAKGFAGTENSYSVTGPKGTDLALVHPLDPEGMPEGTSIRLGSSWYKGYELGGSYNALVADMGTRSGTEHYVDITRGKGDEVTVRIGDDEFDKAVSSLGLGGDKMSAKLSADSSFTEGTAKEVTFDLSSSEGKAAYDRFVFGGKAPSAEAAGVVDVADIQAFSGAKSTGFSLALGDRSVSSPLTDWMAGGLTTTHADGTQDVAWSSKSGRNGMDGELTLDKNGNVEPGSQVVHMRRGGVDAGELESYMRAVRGSDVSYSENQNVVITYTPEDLRMLRRQAADFHTQELNAAPGRRGPAFEDRQNWTTTELLERVDSNEEARLAFAESFPNSEVVVRAQSDEEILDVLGFDPIDVQRDIALDYRGTGKEPTPVGKVTVHPSN